PFKQRKKDGSFIHVRISRINYQHEESEAYLNILEDVSTSFETEKKNQIYKAAFDNTNDMIFITDPDGTITYVNESVSKTLGVSSSDLINTDITLNCGEEDKVFINDSVFHSHIKETVTFTIELITSEGRLLECDIVSTPVFDSNNKLESFVLIAKPNVMPKISTNKIEKETDENHSNKKQKIGKVSNDTVITSSFLSGIFHEILTPMNVILGFTQELMESIETPSPEQKEAIDIINQNRVLILSLMNTIIEFSDIQFNKPEIELSEVAVTEVIENYEKTLNEITGIRDLEFAYGKISSSLRFNIDKKKFLNLTSNLFRLVGRISSQKKLFFSAYQVDDDSFNISISDAFGKSTPQLVETLRSLFIDKKEPKVFGLSKLIIEIIYKLLQTLEGQFVILNENTEKQDVGFRFPVNIVQIIEHPVIKETEKVVPMQTEIQLQKPIAEEEPQLLNMSDEIEIVEEDLSHRNNKTKSKVHSEIEEHETIVEEIKAEPEKLVIGSNKVVVEEKPVVPKSSNGLSSLRCLYIEDQVDSQILFKVQMKDLKNIQFATSFEEALPLLETNEFDFIIMDINLQGEYNGLDAL
ncbi:MAG TPA: PAS domain-containing protein, partial [Ignavibacteriaceae bacterium]